jgi:hypothetical protein
VRVSSATRYLHFVALLSIVGCLFGLVILCIGTLHRALQFATHVNIRVCTRSAYNSPVIECRRLISRFSADKSLYMLGNGFQADCYTNR